MHNFNRERSVANLNTLNLAHNKVYLPELEQTKVKYFSTLLESVEIMMKMLKTIKHVYNMKDFHLFYNCKDSIIANEGKHLFISR